MVIYHNKYENFHQMLFMIFALLFQIAFNKKLLSQKKKHSSRVSHQHGHKVLYLNEVTFGTDALHGYLCNSWCVNCLLFLCILKKCIPLHCLYTSNLVLEGAIRGCNLCNLFLGLMFSKFMLASSRNSPVMMDLHLSVR